jgi:hypothetical protein
MFFEFWIESQEIKIIIGDLYYFLKDILKKTVLNLFSKLSYYFQVYNSNRFALRLILSNVYSN